MNVPITYPTLRLFLDGMLLMMILYTIFCYVIHRQPLFLYYTLYMVTMVLYLHFRASSSHPDRSMNGWDTALESVLFTFYILFASNLMQIRQNDPWSYRTLRSMAAVLLGSGLLSVLLYSMLGQTEWVRWVHLVSRLYLVGCTVLILPRLAHLRHTVLPYFISGTALFISCCAITLLYVIQPAWFSNTAQNAFQHPLLYMQIGVVLEVLCYTMGISVQNRQTEQEKIRYQTQLIEQLRENSQKQQQLNGLRDEIARDLHDEMGSQLASISILSQTTARYVTDERARQRLTTIGQTARQVMDSMREIVWSLNSSRDTIQHIGLRIRDTAQRLFGDSTIRLYVRIPDDQLLHTLTAKQRRELHLIAKECLTNVLRHAQASKVGIHVWSESNSLRLTISDDGTGFDRADLASGLGLTSVRQRARQLNASLRIESEPGDGTTITLICPLSTKTAVSELLADEEPLAYSPSDLSTAA